MILPCEHPVTTGCESAQSILRSSLRRPGAPAGCSRCERLLDTPGGCAASSKVARPTCAPTPPWPLLSAFDGSDADTLCETPDQDERRSARLRPATSAACDCPASRSLPGVAVRPKSARAESNPDNSLPACRAGSELYRPWSARKPAP